MDIIAYCAISYLRAEVRLSYQLPLFRFLHE
jgi:hypothetical protein